MNLKLPIDELNEKDRADVKRVVAELMLSGKSYDEIAQALKDKYGVEMNEKQVEYYVYREFEGVMKSDDGFEEMLKDEDIDILKELKELYLLQRSRVNKLLNFEREIGLPLPESTKNIVVSLSILDKLARVKMQTEVTPFEIRNRLFETILKEIEED